VKTRPAGKWHGFAVEWHDGSALALSAVPEAVPDTGGAEPTGWQAFCGGGRARRLAERVVARHGTEAELDAAVIGAAAASVVRRAGRSGARRTRCSCT
jgi:hypothetical protein